MYPQPKPHIIQAGRLLMLIERAEKSLAQAKATIAPLSVYEPSKNTAKELEKECIKQIKGVLYHFKGLI